MEIRHPDIHIVGMPYVPGVVKGRLRRGIPTPLSNDIAVISHADVDAVVELPAGFIVIEGAPLSHTMIRLLGSGVPTVIIDESQAAALIEGTVQGTEILLDGAAGLVTTRTDTETAIQVALQIPEAGRAIVTADGAAVRLRASIRSAAAASQAVEYGAESIGLVRSEFLMPVDGRPPDTTFLGQTFGEMCAAATPLPVTIRLLDVAADKIPQWMSSIAAVGGALGLQGVRLFDREPARGVIHAQLAAIDQLSEQFELRILIPYPVRYEEVRHWVDTIRSRLSRPVPIGAMIETPAGALDLAHWLDAVDFVAVGCNDLMQCLFAADRDRPELRHYLDPYAPLLFRFFRQLADAAGKRLEHIQLCGLLPQIQGVMPILLGLGYRTFSVEPTLIPHLAATVTATTITDARLLAERVCAAAETRQVVELLGLQTGGSPRYGALSE